MPAVAALLVLVGVGLAYAGITGQSPKAELFAALRGEPKPAPGPKLLTGALGQPATSSAPTGGQSGPGKSVPLTGVATSGGASAQALAAVAWAKRQLGKPYSSDGARRLGPDAFDCSGLTYMAYKQGAGVTIGLDSYAQVRDGREIAGDASSWPNVVRPGDLLFRVGDSPARSHGHVTMAVDAATEIQAPRTGDVVKLSPIPWGRIETVRRIA